MREHIYMLVRMGCLKWNPHSQWSSAVMIVAKPASRGEYRVIVHCKYVDSEVIPTAGCLPNLALILQHLAGLIGLDAWKHLKDSGNFHVQKPLKKCTLRWQIWENTHTHTRLIQTGACPCFSERHDGSFHKFRQWNIIELDWWHSRIRQNFWRVYSHPEAIFQRLLMKNVKLNPTNTDIRAR